MCGHFTLTTPADQLASHFEAPGPPRLTPRYNVAPSQVLAVVGLKPGGNKRGIALLISHVRRASRPCLRSG